MSPTFAIVAGEHSGDILGAGLIRALKARHPDARFTGIGGPLMQAEGLESLFPMEELAVMGLVEVIRHLPRLLAIRKTLVENFIENPPALYIGIDAPDFNLRVEKPLRAAGIKTVHYVSPSVWAWRQGRIRGIAKAVDHMLCLLPFEQQFYEQQPAHRVAATFIGHPLADEIPLSSDKASARAALGLEPPGRCIALMPGSRAGEISRLGEPFIQAAQMLYEQDPRISFVLPVVSEARRAQLAPMLEKLAPDLPLTIVEGQSRQVMAAADAVLLASGTAALEAMLVGRPMVVSYIVNSLSYHIARFMVKLDYYSLPNLLAGRQLVPELIQQQATPVNLATTMLEQLARTDSLESEFERMHLSLRQQASERAADVIDQMLQS